MQLFRITITLKNKKKIDKGGKGTILTLRLANYDPMEMMVILNDGDINGDSKASIGHHLLASILNQQNLE